MMRRTSLGLVLVLLLAVGCQSNDHRSPSPGKTVYSTLPPVDVFLSANDRVVAHREGVGTASDVLRFKQGEDNQPSVFAVCIGTGVVIVTLRVDDGSVTTTSTYKCDGTIGGAAFASDVAGVYQVDIDASSQQSRWELVVVEIV